jgi:hypothetical protein
MFMSALRIGAWRATCLALLAISELLVTDAAAQSTAGTLGDSQNYYNVSLKKAVSALDVAVAFIGSYTAGLPFGAGKSLSMGNTFVVNYVIGGWKASGLRTVQDREPPGIPTELSLAAIGAVRASVLSNQLYGQPDRATFDPAADFYLNKAAFAPLPSFTFGDAPQLFSQLRGFGTVSWNAASLKTITINEHIAFILRPEFFDIPNNMNFSTSTTDANSLAFGKITAAGSPRLGQVSATVPW